MKFYILILMLLSLGHCRGIYASNKYASLFCFGNSYTDTGNYLILATPIVPDILVTKLPYVPPYLAHNGSFLHAANFAVGGTTAIETAFFLKNNLTSLQLLNGSLNFQLGWFDELKFTLCKSKKDCETYFRRSLFLFGEFGINDYTYLLQGGKSLGQVIAFVPKVIRTISSSIEHVISHGAVSIAVAGQVPIGCIPSFLTLYAGPHKHDYDEKTGCLEEFDHLALHHNTLLKESLKQLRRKYPQVKIAYADYYDPFLKLVKSPENYGFIRTPLRVCRGRSGSYNWNISENCGMPGVTACKELSTYVHWDGVHLTESANRHIAVGWLNGRYLDPPILGGRH